MLKIFGFPCSNDLGMQMRALATPGLLNTQQFHKSTLSKSQTKCCLKYAPTKVIEEVKEVLCLLFKSLIFEFSIFFLDNFLYKSG